MAQQDGPTRLSLAQYRVLLALADHRGFSAAAEALGISQPSVSSQLRVIEDRLRLKIFARAGHQITLTPLGRQIMPRLRGMIALADELDMILADHGANRAGALVLGYSTHQFVMPVISEYMRRFPGVALSARCLASQDLFRQMSDGIIQAAFVTAGTLPAGVEALALRRERIVLMAPREHPVARETRLGWAALDGLPLICRERASGTRLCFDRIATQRGVDLTPVLELGSWESMRAAVRSGVGIGVVMAGEIEPGDDFATIDIDDPALWVSHLLICPRQLRDLAPVAALFEVTQKYIEKL